MRSEFLVAGKGAALLDKYRPDWFKEVGTLEGLDLRKDGSCLLTRLYGQYYLGLVELREAASAGGDPVYQNLEQFSREYGFLPNTKQPKFLNDGWKQEITRRRSGVENAGG